MGRTTLRGLWARKRRLFGASIAVVLGVGFLTATLLIGDTLDSSFTRSFEQANAGTDVVVRSATVLGSGDETERADVDASLAEAIAAVPGVEVVVPGYAGMAQLLGSDGDPIGGQGPPTLAGNWIDDPELNPYRIAEGRAPSAPGEVVIDRGSATVGELAVGDTTTIRTPDPLEVEVVGIATFGSDDSLGGTTFVGLVEPQAAELLSQPGQVAELRVRGDGSVDDDQLAQAVAAALPDGAEALTGAALTDEQVADIQTDFLGFVKTFLLAFAGVAVVVATFSIHNTFTILIAQRSRESALLRAIGATRRQVLASVGLEAVLIGALASLVGLVAGLGLGLGLRALLGGMGLDLAGPALVVEPASLAIAFGVGLLTTLVASIVPSVRASRVAPIEALRETAVEAATLSVIRSVAGALVTLAGVVAVVSATGTPDGAVARAGLGALLVLVGVVVLGPTIARPAARLLGAPVAKLRGQPGRLAQLNATRNPRRTSGSALALVIGTTVVALFATFGSSIRQSIDDTVDQSFGGDLVITQDGFSGAKLSPQLATRLAELPEVERVAALTDAVVTLDGADAYPTAGDPAAMADLLEMDVQSGSLGEMEVGQLAISERWATDHDLQRGDVVEVGYADGATDDLEVAVVYGQGDLLGDLLMTTQDWAPHVTTPGDVAVLVDLADGVSVEEGRAAVTVVADDLGSPDPQDRQEYVDQVAGEVDSLLTLVYGLLVLAIVIALMGLANTLSLSIHERTRELGLLRAVGLTRAGLRATVRWESVITAVVGTVVGLTLGTFLGWGIVRAFAAQEGFVRFLAPTTTLVAVTVIAVLAGVVAAIGPARRAARLDVLDAIAEP